MKNLLYSALVGGIIFAALPSSTNYGLHNYGFGSGGTSNSTSTNYGLNGTTGETSGVESTSTNYKTRSGNNNALQANVPNAPTFTNTSNNYDKLKFIINPGPISATDYKYSIAISTDNFVTTKFVQADNTIGNTKVYQSYATWGGASGQNVIGLSPSTTYKIKVNAIQSRFTETEYSQVATAATVPPSITFSIATDSQASAPFSTNFASLLPNTVATASDKILVNLTTNANSGATVFVSSLNSGLVSARSGNFTISSATADLSGASSGYGAQSVSATQASGGPLTVLSPFNGAAQNVGVLGLLLKPIYYSTAPITSGTASFKLMAKATQSTPSSSDYVDVLSLTAAGSF